MAYAIENGIRAKAALLSAIQGKAQSFDPKAQAGLIAVFDDPINELEVGRVLLFQQYFFDRFGFLPVIIGQVSLCLKVFFSIPDLDKSLREEIRKDMQSDDFSELCTDLRVSQVQFAGQLKRIK